jgi:hypothetical protein
VKIRRASAAGSFNHRTYYSTAPLTVRFPDCASAADAQDEKKLSIVQMQSLWQQGNRVKIFTHNFHPQFSPTIFTHNFHPPSTKNTPAQLVNSGVQGFLLPLTVF